MKMLRFFLCGLGCIILLQGCVDSPPSQQTQLNQSPPSLLQAEMDAKERNLTRMKIAELAESQSNMRESGQDANASRIYLTDDNLQPTLIHLQTLHEGSVAANHQPLPASSLGAEKHSVTASTPGNVSSLDTTSSTNAQEPAKPTLKADEGSVQPAQPPESRSTTSALEQPASADNQTTLLHPVPTNTVQSDLVTPSTVPTPTGKDNPFPLKESYELKQQKLKELLILYKADKITPYEYHRLRNKIVSDSE